MGSYPDCKSIMQDKARRVPWDFFNAVSYRATLYLCEIVHYIGEVDCNGIPW